MPSYRVFIMFTGNAEYELEADDTEQAKERALVELWASNEFALDVQGVEVDLVEQA